MARVDARVTEALSILQLPDCLQGQQVQVRALLSSIPI